MKKIGIFFVFLSVVLLVLCVTPRVFCQSYDLDSLTTEMVPADSDDLNGINSDGEVTALEVTSEAMSLPQALPTPKVKFGTLTVINSSSYCCDGYLDGKERFTNLQPGAKITVKKVQYGSHSFTGKECNGGTHYWSAYTYTQGSSFTLTLH